jgi:hypothetical protein
MTFTRRALLRGGLSVVIGSAACVVQGRPPPEIAHPRYPLGLIARRRVAPRQIVAGATSIDITPPAGSRVFLAGFGFQRAMSSVRDPISARCIYLDDGLHRVALVVADAIGLLLPTVERVRRLVGNGIEVAVASTHDHDGPDTMGYWGKSILHAVPTASGIDLQYQRALERRLAGSVALAAQSAVPARIAFCTATIPEGVVRNLRPGVLDDRVEIVEISSEEGGRAIATLVNFACHPETLGDRNRRLSADFPGALRRRLELQRGGTAIFANGSLGGMITPVLDDGLDVEGRERVMERLGERIAERALLAMKGTEKVEVRSIRYRRRRIELPSNNALFAYIERVGLVEPRARGKGGGLLTEVGRIDLGPASWALIPGEPTPLVGGRIKARLESSGAVHPAIIALANDELGYILDPAQYDDPEFSYEVSVSVGREAAPTIERALAESNAW